uniref:Uncharacterized protein n=1 Tax=Knipowitschia caucasica TaxID=637954 RepID=A0AAV2MN38_KNICA
MQTELIKQVSGSYLRPVDVTLLASLLPASHPSARPISSSGGGSESHQRHRHNDTLAMCQTLDESLQTLGNNVSQ